LGCPECGNIDKSKFSCINENGLIGINRNRTNPENDIRKNINKEVVYTEPRKPTKKDILKYRKAFKELFNL
jgi:hypothetical protein